MGDFVISVVRDADRLSKRSDEINVQGNPKAIASVVADLKDTLKAHPGMMALSAPQIGVNARVFCIRFSNNEIKTYVNPMITKVQGKCLMIERDVCSEDEYLVQRPDRALVTYQSPSGVVSSDVLLKNPVAALFEQMTDILDGTLGLKYEWFGLKVGSDYYEASDDERKELHEWFLNTYVPSRLKEGERETDGDDEMRKYMDAMRFTISVLEGKTEIVADKNGELDFDASSVKAKERDDRDQKAYEGALKKRYGID